MTELRSDGLRLAPGGGHVARRATSVLFLPAPDAGLLSAFGEGLAGAELQAVASATVAAGFEVGRFVAVSWSAGTVRVMAFGDIAVETDQPTLPMLSGAGSRTWVEHTLVPDGDATVTVTVTGDDGLDASSDLREGIALAGGFQLELARAQPDRDGDGPASTAAEPVAPGAPASSEPVDLPAPRGAPADLPGPTAPVGRPDTGGTTPRPPALDPDDHQAALAAIQAAAMGEDGAPLQRADAPTATDTPAITTSASTDSADDPDVTLPPPDVSDLLQGIGDGSGRSSLLDAKLCSRQHANPPTIATCAICGDLLPPGSGSVVHVARPSLGALALDDGTTVPLDRELLIGRNPARDAAPERAGLERVKVPGDKVSRSHLAVRFQGWDVVVADLGSTNGTFIVPHPGGQVMAVDPDRPQLVDPGATVYFGSRSFTVLGRRS